MSIYDMLIEDEGLRLSMYDDSTGKPLKKGDIIKGNPTIGVGHNLYTPITERAAMVILDDDIKSAELDCMKSLPFFQDLDQARRNVLICMCFNMGIYRLLGFHRMLASCALKDWEAAAAHGLDSAWAKQVGDRAQRLMATLRDAQ